MEHNHKYLIGVAYPGPTGVGFSTVVVRASERVKEAHLEELREQVRQIKALPAGCNIVLLGVSLLADTPDDPDTLGPPEDSGSGRHLRVVRIEDAS